MKQFLTVISLITMTSLSVQAEIFSVNTITEIQTKIEEVLKSQKPTNILAAFDIDMTLTEPNHPAARYPMLMKYSAIYKEIVASLSDEKKDLLLGHIVSGLPQKLVEEQTPTLIKAWQNQGIKVISLTASLTGKVGSHERFEDVRYTHLHNFGFTFDQSFSQKDIFFKDLPIYRGHYPTFYKGILLSNGEQGKTSKGAVMVAFLKVLELAPKVIVLVDDKKKHLEDVRKHLETHDPSILFIGIEYKGAFQEEGPSISAEEFKTFWQKMASKVKGENE